MDNFVIPRDAQQVIPNDIGDDSYILVLKPGANPMKVLAKDLALTSKFTISSTAPASPKIHDRWINSNLEEFVFYNGAWQPLGISNAVLFTSQTLTDEQKLTVRDNVGANKVWVGLVDPTVDNSILVQDGDSWIYSGSPSIKYDRVGGTWLPLGSLGGLGYIYVKAVGTPSENASELQAAYTKAKTMSPSASNRLTVVAAPGKYDFSSTAFIIDTPYVDVVSLTGNADVFLFSDNDYGFSGGNAPIVVNNFDNIKIKGINCGSAQFGLNTGGVNNVYDTCVGFGEYSFGGVSVGTFINCTGGDYSFGGNGGSASGIFINCKGGYRSFGGGGFGIASGVFTGCVGGACSFGGDDSGAGGEGFATGVFRDCVGGDFSFGGGYGGAASGEFINCTGGASSFGGAYGVASGTFDYCNAGTSSFGGSIASGVFTYCKAGLGSFGSGAGGSIASTARLYHCKLSGGVFADPVAGGKLVACIDGNDDLVVVS